MDEILLYISNTLIVCSYLLYLILSFVKINNKKLNLNGFSITKDILKDYNSINIIESKNIITMYNIKRRVIKIASRCYLGNSINEVSLPLIEAGIYVIDDNKNRILNLFRFIFSSLKYLYIFPLLAIFINSVTYNIADAKISIIFLIILSAIGYFLISVKDDSFEWISNNLVHVEEIDKDDCNLILNFIDKIFLCDKLIFLSEFIMIVRFIMILL